MNTSSSVIVPRLLAAVGTLALLGGFGLSASRPAHSTGGPTPVLVANSLLPTRNIDSEARQPFQTEVTFFQGNGVSFPTFSTFMVPAGKTLVIQSASAFAYAIGSSQALLQIRTTAGGTQTSHYAGFLAPGIGASNFTLPLTEMSLHADPGSAVGITILRTTPPTNNVGYYDDVTISGYLVDTP